MVGKYMDLFPEVFDSTIKSKVLKKYEKVCF